MDDGRAVGEVVVGACDAGEELARGEGEVVGGGAVDGDGDSGAAVGVSGGRG